MADHLPRIQVGAAQDGTVTYLVDHLPGELPAVRGRDLLAAWEVAREAARRSAWSGGRAFRFRRQDGGWTEAVDRTLGMQTGYGLSVCLRLLALVDLLARAPWTAALVQLDRRGAELHPALLRLAAETRLTDDARFDETGFRACLHMLPSSPHAGA